MKTIALVGVALTAFCVSAQDNVPGPDNVIRNPDGSIKRFSKEEFRKLPKEVQRAMGREFFRSYLGGMVEKPGVAKGHFKLINSSKAVTKEEISTIIKPLTKASDIRMVAEDGAFTTLNSAKELLRQHEANAGIFLVDSDTLPRITLAPEDGWAVVNVKALGLDNPSHSNHVKRVNTELVRAFSYVCGSNLDSHSAIMKPVSELKDLDDLSGDAFIPTNLQAMGRQLALFGIQPRYMSTYREACRQGWAPTPTNDVQKAIWDDVHALPTEPIKIKPETKKVRE